MSKTHLELRVDRLESQIASIVEVIRDYSEAIYVDEYGSPTIRDMDIHMKVNLRDLADIMEEVLSEC